MLIETNENDSLLSGRRVLSSPKGYQIDIQLEGHTYKLRVDIARNSTRWGAVADTVYQYHLSTLQKKEKKHFRSLRVHSIVNVRKDISLDLSAIVRYKDLSSYLYPSTYKMQMEGPIERFSENILVAKIISQYLTIPKELNSLLRVSKRFHRLVLNDGVWDNVEYSLFTLWQGLGKTDTEDNYWAKYKREKGLPTVNTVRLRWLSHNTSRLRIYFGSIPCAPTSMQSTMLMDFYSMTDSIAPFLGINTSQPSISHYSPLTTVGSHISAARKLLVLGCKGEKISSHVMERLYSLTPSSATAFTINDKYQPLFSTAKLDALEIPRYRHCYRGGSGNNMYASSRPSAASGTISPKHLQQQHQRVGPSNPQQNVVVRVHDGMRNKTHEGIRKESDGFMDYKCFGDMRLTIVQIESALYGRQGDEFYDYFEPLRNVVGSVLVVGHGDQSVMRPPNSNALSLHEKLHRLLTIVKGNNDSARRCDYPTAATRGGGGGGGRGHLDAPTMFPITPHPIILVYVVISQESEQFDHDGAKDYIHSIILGVHASMSRCLAEIDAPNCWKYSWYIQPVPEFKTCELQQSFDGGKMKMSDLRSGFLGGLNWLLRAIGDAESRHD